MHLNRLSFCFGKTIRTPFNRSILERLKAPYSIRLSSHQTKSLKEIVRETKSTIGDIPRPSGSWQQHYDARNRKWNLFLVGSFAVFGTSIFTLWKIGAFNFYSPPELKKMKLDAEAIGYINKVSADSPPTKASPDSPVTVTQPSSDPPLGDNNLSKDTRDSSVFPDSVPYLIVGAGTAAFSAYRAIRASDPKAQVLLIGEENFMPYMRPPLSKELWFDSDYKNAIETLKFKQWNGKERSVFFEKEAFFCKPQELKAQENGGVALITGCKIQSIDVKKQIATAANGNKIKYDKCLIATGGRPRNMSTLVAGGDEVLKKVTLFRTVDDLRNLRDAIGSAASVTIIGGGFLGSELACALGKLGLKENFKVNQIFPESGNMGKVLPAYLSNWSTEKIVKEGVSVLADTFVTRACEENGRVKLTLSNGDQLLTDHVIAAVGLEPNVDIAKSSGLETDPNLGGILVNAELQARNNLWVAGDAACFYDIHLGRRRVEHHDHAVVSGRLAGENMTGAAKPYWHQSMFWSDLGPEIGYEAIGVIDSSLPTVGVFTKKSEKDTPRFATTKSGDNLRSETEQTQADTSVDKTTDKTISEDYGKGVVFYIRDDTVVGLVLWNVFNKMAIARKIIKDQVKKKDIEEISKLFSLYENPLADE